VNTLSTCLAVVGRDVRLSLRFSDGRTRVLTGKLLSIGLTGGVVDAEDWPTSFLHCDVVSCELSGIVGQDVAAETAGAR
jgi:hypothetical protein